MGIGTSTLPPQLLSKSSPIRLSSLLLLFLPLFRAPALLCFSSLPPPLTLPTSASDSTSNPMLSLLSLLLFLILVPFASPRPAASPDPYETLQAHGLPSGLFPKGIANFSLSDDGLFVASLNKSCTAKLDNAVKYNATITGALSYGQIGSISGVSAQDLFLWFPVLGIRVDVPSSGVIYFDVGVVNKRLAVSLFDTPPDCTPETDIEDSVDGFEISRVFSLSQQEKLREEVDQENSENAVI